MKKLALSLVLCLCSSSAFADLTPKLIGGNPDSKHVYPEVIYISSGNARCSATVIGPRVILTAAHCVRDGAQIVPVGLAVFEVDDVAYAALCHQAPLYRDQVEDHDMALCKTDKELRGKFASIAMEGPKIGDLVQLTGYGCTQPGGGQGNDGILRVGLAKVTKLPAGTDNWFYTEAKPAALCYGDSGGPAFVKGSHELIGVNSRGDIRVLSLLTATYLDKSKEFFHDFAEQMGVEICGINAKC